MLAGLALVVSLSAGCSVNSEPFAGGSSSAQPNRTALNPLEIFVHPDGTGDVPTFADALEAAAPGALIVLTPGTHVADALVIDHERIEIVGFDDTIVEAAAGRLAPVITVAGGSVSLGGFTIRAHPDGDPSDQGPLVAIRGGTFQLHALTVQGSGSQGMVISSGSGLVDGQFDHNAGAGLEIGAHVGDEVTISSGFAHNLVGLLVFGAPNVEGSLAVNNTDAGMRWAPGAAGRVESNGSAHNGGADYDISELANPVLERNGPPGALD